MVVDDHPLFRRGLVALLTQEERFVVLHEAADAGEAVRCVAREQPDLILSATSQKTMPRCRWR